MQVSSKRLEHLAGTSEWQRPLSCKKHGQGMKEKESFGGIHACGGYPWIAKTKIGGGGIKLEHFFPMGEILKCNNSNKIHILFLFLFVLQFLPPQKKEFMKNWEKRYLSQLSLTNNCYSSLHACHECSSIRFVKHTYYMGHSFYYYKISKFFIITFYT